VREREKKMNFRVEEWKRRGKKWQQKTAIEKSIKSRRRK
jgi:hypothetical protein